MSGSKRVFDRKHDWGVDLGDARSWGWNLPKNSLSCCITSPPYYGLRDYGTGDWEGGDLKCEHASVSGLQGKSGQRVDRTFTGAKPQGPVCSRCGAVRIDQQIGLEQTPEEYVEQLVEVFRGVRRALHPTGSLWLDLGDSYAGSWGARGRGPGTETKRRDLEERHGTASPARSGFSSLGIKPKDVLGIPWMVAFALRADGWYLRQWMPWVKRNPMPESAEDRPGTACEMVFLLTKEPDCFFDMTAVKKPSPEPDRVRRDRMGGNKINATKHSDGADYKGGTDRNFRSGDLWFDSVGMLFDLHSDDETILGLDVSTHPYKGSHFAVMPKKLIRPMILAGTSEKGVCPHCGAPWTRQIEKVREATRPGTGSKVTGDSLHDGNRDPERHVTRTKTVGWEPSCQCKDNTLIPAIVGDPFAGSGTVLAVARELGRRAVGCELNRDYLKLIEKRVGGATPPLF